MSYFVILYVYVYIYIYYAGGLPMKYNIIYYDIYIYIYILCRRPPDEIEYIILWYNMT